MIENLPFKNPTFWIKLITPIIIFAPKKQVDQELVAFAEIVMAFWHYYQLKTYRDKYKLVFKMNQTNFNELIKINKMVEEKKKKISLN